MISQIYTLISLYPVDIWQGSSEVSRGDPRQIRAGSWKENKCFNDSKNLWKSWKGQKLLCNPRHNILKATDTSHSCTWWGKQFEARVIDTHKGRRLWDSIRQEAVGNLYADIKINKLSDEWCISNYVLKCFEFTLYVHILTWVMYIYIYIYVCVCVCVLYDVDKAREIEKLPARSGTFIVQLILTAMSEYSCLSSRRTNLCLEVPIGINIDSLSQAV